MKYLSSILLLVLALTMTVAAQQGQGGGARVGTEIIASSSTAVVKGEPYSADAISESIQILADGNKISRSNTTRMFRDSEGRTRRENVSSNGNGGGGGGFTTTFSTAPSAEFAYFGFGFQDTISIFDPVSNVRYSLNPTAKTARRTKASFGMVEGAFFGTTAQSAGVATRAQIDATRGQLEVARGQLDAARAQMDETNALRKVQVEAATARTAQVAALPSLATTVVSDINLAGTLIARGSNAGKTESLGTRDIEGITAEGTRTITTIQAGAIGNERPIEIVYERWYSKELQLIVYSRHSDPRFGEQIYRLTNVSRNDPDRSLFAPPADYKILSEPTMNVYTTRPREDK
jgi:hypothetical protein